MARQAWVNLRYTVPERRAVVCQGLRRVGFEIAEGLTRTPNDGDLLLSWNRIHEADEVARIFTARGLSVIVMENCSFGSNYFAGKNWYHVALNFHNVSGQFPVGGPERWDYLGVELLPWRTSGEVVVLGSRGIGPAQFRMPGGWISRQSGRVRPHPGRNANAIPLEQDLANCGRVITWGSAGAITALRLGIPVESHMPNWIGAQDNTGMGRLAMFRRLAHAQWTMHEIASGEPFARLLSWQGER